MNNARLRGHYGRWPTEHGAYQRCKQPQMDWPQRITTKLCRKAR